jgi:methyl-accepting chemotaxis protein
VSNRLSVNLLLKAVIATLAAIVVVVLAQGAWDSWRKLKSVDRIAAAADASTYIFTALHNLRLDRTTASRALQADQQLTSVPPEIKKPWDGEMPALASALVVLKTMDFPEQSGFVTELDAATRKLAALHGEAATAMTQPKASRRANLAQEYIAGSTAMIDLLDKISSRLTVLVKLDDAYIDQLMELKQLAWVVRNVAGDVSVMVSSPMAGQPVPSDLLLKYTAGVSKVESTWAALENVAKGLPLPAKFNDAANKAKSEFFSREFTELRLKTLMAVIEGKPTGYTVATWTPMAVAKLNSLLGVADAALEVARDHASQQRAIAARSLAVDSGLLVVSMALAAGLMVVVSRRVTGPLLKIQQAMLKLAGGDLTADVAMGARKDEIGALGGAMQTFKASMVEADRLRVEQKDTEARTVAQRKADMRKLADEFQAAVGNIVDTVSSASTELEAAAGTLTKTAETTQRLSGVVASASEDASANVQSVATATEEMTGSVNEIARQVQESSKIAEQAVAQAGKTDARITELSAAASRIGDVVKLITAIAEQTNLLALNATIEAARAGEAGKGFAVVAQEVKALASQTAKATDEIGSQIAAMQSATQDSVAAIKEISGTIGRIAEIAGTIAAAVEEQGAATQEIARNVQQASQGTSQVATNITDVNRGASETGTASSQVLHSAQSLARESGHLKTEVEKFVQMVRAA